MMKLEDRTDVPWASHIRAALARTKSIARHGRCTPELKAARKRLNELLHMSREERDPEACSEAISQHDRAAEDAQ